ncbi:DUF2812 domain-containing protein [Bacillus sp. PS06]|uniref:DUF2812 domain-containing protein n=1 Tax=Bacillus sp. PS06 TaxID=2764176 RepID=UPI0017811E7D|nr:DUF2812 domain-containing protein [Bacillus sp. PS06]MBD8070644.1 DUF2812 domain-containing protein [Bacillus sp. PS06]
MRKFKFFLDFDKEEKWLEEMAKKGYQLKDRTFGYKFLLTDPEDAKIKIDYRKFKKQEDFIDYCTLFEDSGWKHIAGSKNSGTQYFQKLNDAMEEDIFSDKLSKAGKYKRLSDMFTETTICFIPIFVALLTTDVIDVNALLHPKELFYTPGLWEMKGISFWGAFLFETPFVLFRSFIWLFIPVMLILNIVFGYQAKKLYEMNKE